MKPGYYTVVIPWSARPTKWHPTNKTGPFSTLTRGSFGYEHEAYEWAEANLGDQPYTVKFIETGDMDVYHGPPREPAKKSEGDRLFDFFFPKRGGSRLMSLKSWGR